MNLPGEQLIIKLWETLAEKGVGSLLAPWQVARVGKAHNEVRQHEVLALAQAERDAADIRTGKKRLGRTGLLESTEQFGVQRLPAPGRIEPTLDSPTAPQIGHSVLIADEMRHEVNSAKAILHAEDLLSQEERSPPDRPIDTDWLFTWRDYAGRVSNQDLQRLWGSVLAGEVMSPGSYSIRTLDFLRSLTQAEANRIALLARFVIEGRVIKSEKDYLEEQGVSFDLLLKMQELGVLTGVDGTGLQTRFRSQQAQSFVRVLRSHGKALVIRHDDRDKTLEQKIYLLTGLGNEILSLGTFLPGVEYMRRVGKAIAALGYQVQLADWRQLTETSGEYVNEERIDA